MRHARDSTDVLAEGPCSNIDPGDLIHGAILWRTRSHIMALSLCFPNGSLFPVGEIRKTSVHRSLNNDGRSTAGNARGRKMYGARIAYILLEINDLHQVKLKLKGAPCMRS